MNGRSALVIGATGLVGGHIVDILEADWTYSKIVLLTRKPVGRTSDKIQEHVVDFDNLQDSADLFAVDDVFCAIGTTIKKAGSKEAFRHVDRDYTLEAARLALEKGAKAFLVVTALGANPYSPIFYNRVKGQVEKELSRMPFESVDVFRPSILLGEREEYRLGEELTKKIFEKLESVFNGPLKKFRGVQAESVASAMVMTAKFPPRKGFNIFDSIAIREISDID